MKKWLPFTVSAMFVALSLAGLPVRGDAALLGPSPYLCFDRTGTSGLEPGYTGSCGTSDSPFAADANAGNFTYFHLETFEDHLLNTPGVSASAGGVTSVVFGPTIHDSVDGDDGTIDGSGLGGDSFFSSNGSAGITFSFNAGVLGALPTHVGIVWTDGGGTISFEAFDENLNSLGTLFGNHADGTFSGTTAEDRFYGAVNAGGISSIFIANSGGGIEVDHLQYGLIGERGGSVPEPSTLGLFGVGLLGLGLFLRRGRKG